MDGRRRRMREGSTFRSGNLERRRSKAETPSRANTRNTATLLHAGFIVRPVLVGVFAVVGVTGGLVVRGGFHTRIRRIDQDHVE